MIPRTYEDWHRCITQDCGITLDAAYVSDRLQQLGRRDGAEAQRFVHLYGEDHWAQVLTWFREVRKEHSIT